MEQSNHVCRCSRPIPFNFPADPVVSKVKPSSSAKLEIDSQRQELEKDYAKEKDEFISKNVVENFINNEIKDSKLNSSESDESTYWLLKHSKINNKYQETKLRKQAKARVEISRVKRLGSKLGAKLNQRSDIDVGSSFKKTDVSKPINKEKEISSSPKSEPFLNNASKFSLEKSSDREITSEKSSDYKNRYMEQKNIDSVSADGWDLEDTFEVPDDSESIPKEEEFEKELFPVLNKLSSLSTVTSGSNNNEDTNKEKHNDTSSANSWGNWGGGWGVSSFLSTATEGVSTLTSQVSAGFNTVFESGLGAPDPEFLAQVADKENPEKISEEKSDAAAFEATEDNDGSCTNYPSSSVIGIGGFSNLISGVSQLSSKVIYEGLDSLENLGKKTMEVLQEGDPGLRKKRAMFFQEDGRPVLSQILREAKEVAEKSSQVEEEKQAARKVHFETLFDDYQGLVHLKALEMLSEQCQFKLQNMMMQMSDDEAIKDFRETLEEVKDLCELSDEEDEESDKDDEECDTVFSKKVSESIKLMGVPVSPTKLIEVSESVSKWLESESSKSLTASDIHQKAVSSMAEFTSVSMETFHRSAELLLIKEKHTCINESESLTQLTGILCARVSRMATKFTLLLSKEDENKANNQIITTIFNKSANCSSYIQDACRLLIPVLQLAASQNYCNKSI